MIKLRKKSQPQFHSFRTIAVKHPLKKTTLVFHRLFHRTCAHPKPFLFPFSTVDSMKTFAREYVRPWRLFFNFRSLKTGLSEVSPGWGFQLTTPTRRLTDGKSGWNMCKDVVFAARIVARHVLCASRNVNYVHSFMEARRSSKGAWLPVRSIPLSARL